MILLKNVLLRSSRRSASVGMLYTVIIIIIIIIITMTMFMVLSS